jgi:hypothetical protein
LRLASHASYWAFSSAFAAIGAMVGTNPSISPRGTGTSMQIGSPSRNVIHSFGRVTFQFMVKVLADQSVSTTPSSAWMPSFGWLLGPFTHRLMPGGVRNRYGSEKVTTPYPKWLLMAGSNRLWNRSSMSFLCGPPYQYRSNVTGQRTNQPFWLAMFSGRQRYGNRWLAESIHSRS